MYCKFCGKQIPEGSRFCNYCGGEQDDGSVDSISEGEDGEIELVPDPPPPPPPVQNAWKPPVQNAWKPPPDPPRKAAPPDPPPPPPPPALSRRQKAVGFWTSHPIFSNLVVFICAVTVFFVALFSPIKMPWYGIYGGGTPENEFTVVRSDQSIFQFVRALPYFMGEKDDDEAVLKEMQEASAAAEKEFIAWLERHESASDDEKLQKRYELIAEHLSDVNCFRFIALQGGYHNTIIWTTLLLGIVVVVLAAIMTINSLVAAIKCIVGMCKRRTNFGLFPYLKKMFALSTAGVTLTMCAPLLCVGGGMLAVALITAVMYFVCAVVKAVFVNHCDVKTLVLRIVVTLLAAALFVMLCADPFYATDVEQNEAVVAPAGFGLYVRLLYMFAGSDGAGTAFESLPNNLGIAFAQYVAFACVAVPLAAKALLRSLRRIIDMEYGKPSRNLAGTAIALAVAVILGLLAKPVYDFCYNSFGEGHYFDMLCKMRPIVWVCVALAASTAIFDKIAFRKRC